ncbi:endoplasmic reticulum-based factor for assembly of V-ATPase-domain-containing protein [Phycomyces nitens]|nr:endoplasmic reticulum-based factor for assembly of V-ATPase-domain-containing protein [Phycomyces nitens]
MQLTLTARIQDALRLALADPSFNMRSKEEAKNAVESSLDVAMGVSFSLLQELAQFLSHSEDSNGRLWLHELIRGSGVYHEPKPVEPKDPVFQAYLEQLRQEQAEREYARMVSSVVTSEQDKYMFRIRPDELKEVKGHVTTIINIAFSMVAVYVAVFVASKTMTGDLGVRVLLAFGGAIGIGAVETILYVRYASKVLSPPKKKTIRKKTTKAQKALANKTDS